jgi:hypothetical protein
MRRAVSALEHLAEDPVIQMEVGPPVCPHCNKVNPRVKTDVSEATGRLFEFAVQFYCLECNTGFFGVPVQWSMHQETMTLRAELEGRISGNGDQP